MINEDLLNKVAGRIANSEKIVAFTGAGISVESGIPPFRGKNGLWQKYDPWEFGHISSFKRNPEKCWQMLGEMAGTLLKAKPNPAHYSLAELEKMGKLDCVITQNVDNLHQDAGSKNVIEFHGNFKSLKCLKCKKNFLLEDFSFDDFPPRCDCDSYLKPDIIFFGESLPIEEFQKGIEKSEKCDLMLLIGTSAVVYPASNIPYTAKRNKACIVEINVEKTDLSSNFSDYFIQGKAGEVLPELIENVEEVI